MSIATTTAPAALASDLVHHAPHSPFSTLLALASFETLGLHDWPPYVFNGFVLAAFLFFCARLLGRLPGLAFACTLGFCLTIPLALLYELLPLAAALSALSAMIRERRLPPADAPPPGVPFPGFQTHHAPLIA